MEFIETLAERDLQINKDSLTLQTLTVKPSKLNLKMAINPTYSSLQSEIDASTTLLTFNKELKRHAGLLQELINIEGKDIEGKDIEGSDSSNKNDKINLVTHLLIGKINQDPSI